jgi:hypothetical protein
VDNLAREPTLKTAESVRSSNRPVRPMAPIRKLRFYRPLRNTEVIYLTGYYLTRYLSLCRFLPPLLRGMGIPLN